MIKLLVAVGFLGLNAYTYYFLAHAAVIPPRESFASFPDQLGDWRCRKRETVDQAVIDNLGVSDFLLCDFVRAPRDVVNVYVGYHETQIREEGGGAGENSIHPPSHCLPGSGWDIIDNVTVPLELPGLPAGPATAKRFVIAKGELRALVYYWYQSRGRVESEDWMKVLSVGWDRATRGRTDGALVRFTVPLHSGGESQAEAAFADLAPRILARLPAHVPE